MHSTSMQKRKLTRILRVLTSPSLLKGAIAVRIMPSINRLLEKLLPHALYARINQLEVDMAEARFRLLQIEAHQHLARVGLIAPVAPRQGQPGQVEDAR